MLVILNLSVLAKGDVVGMKIGNPVNFEDIPDNSQQTPATLTNESTPSNVVFRSNVATPNRMNGNINSHCVSRISLFFIFTKFIVSQV